MDVTPNITEIENTTQRYELLQELGDCYASVGNYSRARHCYEQAATLGPDESGPYVGLGVVALQQEDFEDAEIAFRVACRLEPNCSKAYAGLAMVAQQQGECQNAFDLYLKCLEFDSDNMTALLGLFQVSCEMGSFAKVIHYLRTYLDSHPNDTAVMFSLAALYVKDDQPEPAHKLLLDIASQDPNNTDAVNLLEEVERSLSQKKEVAK